MGSISEHFNRSEFECKCGCGLDTVDVTVLDILEVVRAKYNKPIHIHCGCRCKKHNKEVGGVDGSQHTFCRAADFDVEDVPHEEVYDYIDGWVGNLVALGIYDWGIHMDSRTNAGQRWDKRSDNG